MRWLRRLFGVPTFELKIAGEPVREFNLDHWVGIAGMFRKVDGLEACLQSDFRDVMTKLRELPADDKSHGERIRLVQKAVTLWDFLEMPRHAIAQANTLRDSLRKEQESPELNQGPSGPQQ